MTEIIALSAATIGGEQIQTVNARDLHAFLGVKTEFKDWIARRIKDFGFVENTDFCSFLSESTGGRQSTNHQLTIDMAKQLCMIQRTEIGRKFREYFIEIEEAWNSPEAVMARALRIANKELEKVKRETEALEELNAVQSQQIAELQPKASYYDVVLNCKDALSVSVIAKDYGWSAKKMNQYLHEHGVQYKQGSTWLLYARYAEQGYTSTRTNTHLGKDGDVHTSVHTYWTQKGRLFIYDLLKENGVLPLVEQMQEMA